VKGTTLSHSRADKYGKCGEQYRLSYIEHVPEIPSLAQLGGRAVHEYAQALELFRLGLGPAPAGFAVLFEMELAKAELESGLPRDKFKASGRKTVARPNGEDIAYWRDVLGPDMCERLTAFDWGEWTVATDLPEDSNGNTNGLEYHVEVDGFQGFVDRIDQDKHGNKRAVDYKSGQRIYPSVQTELYMIALQKLGVRCVYGGYYLARKAELTYRPVKWSVSTFDTYLGLHRTGIDAEFYMPHPGEHCGWCSVSDHCAYKA
jgi:hypothetical protein